MNTTFEFTTFDFEFELDEQTFDILDQIFPKKGVSDRKQKKL